MEGADEMAPVPEKTEPDDNEATTSSNKRKAKEDGESEVPPSKVAKTGDATVEPTIEEIPAVSVADAKTETSTDEARPAQETPVQKELGPVERAVKEIKAAYIAAKRRYRVSPSRTEKLQEALTLYQGTHIFHNYTINKTFKDPSSQRHIKSFVVNPKPIQIRDTEWLSIKVHGQSFMMHQIRKMIAMAVMVTRCGAPTELITESYGPRRISIPKAPGLGLMLERPMFEEFNKRAEKDYGREQVDFSKYEDQIQEFKDKEIYRRMFEAEEKENA
jgi:tRNA pseudouridine38-40 synthase